MTSINSFLYLFPSVFHLYFTARKSISQLFRQSAGYVLKSEQGDRPEV